VLDAYEGWYWNPGEEINRSAESLVNEAATFLMMNLERV
jgi:hypothetical protein